MDPQALIYEAIQASKSQPLVVDNEKDDYFRPNLNGWLAKAAAAGFRMYELLKDQEMSALKASIFFGKCKKIIGVIHQIEVENPSDEEVVGWLLGTILDGVNDRKLTCIDLAGNVSWSPLFSRWKYGWEKLMEEEKPPTQTFTGGSNPPVIPGQFGSKREQRANDLGWDPLPDSLDENW